MALKILLADDSMTAQNLGKKILTDAGYEVVTVSNGAAAVRKIAEAKPQVCILDIYMPGYTGLEVCARIKNSAQTSRIPVLLTVGKMEPYKPEEGARVRADGVIVKPFEATELLRAVQRFSARNHGTRPPEPLLGPATSVEKTVRLTREQIQQMMDPNSQHWRESAVTQSGSQPLQIPSEMASAPMFDVDDVLSTEQKLADSEPAPSPEAQIAPFLSALSPAAAVHDDAAPVHLPEDNEKSDLDVQAVSSAVGSPLPGFVDYVIAAEANSVRETTGSVIPMHAPAPIEATAAVEEVPAGLCTATATLDAPVAEVSEPPVTAAPSAVMEPVVPAVQEPSQDDTQKLDPEILAAARRASLAAEISLRIDNDGVPPASESAAETLPVTPEKDSGVSAIAQDMASTETVKPIPVEIKVEAEPAPDVPVADSAIPPVDSNLEVSPQVNVQSVPDPFLQVAESDRAEIKSEAGLEPTSRSAESDSVPITEDPGLTSYQPVATPTNGTEPRVAAADFAVAPAEPEQEPELPAVAEVKEGTAPKPAWDEVPEEIAAALDSLGTHAPAHASATVIPIASAQAAVSTEPRLRCWAAEEVAVPEAELTVSLLEEMQRSKSLREQKPAEVAPTILEATVRDDQNSPDSKFVPGAGGTPRTTRDVAPASELAAAMAAAFGGALPSSDLARAEATQPISEEVRRFALGDAYKPKPRAGFSGAAIQDSEEVATTASLNELRLAKAVSRALDRMKPQIVAEVLKELKALEE